MASLWSRLVCHCIILTNILCIKSDVLGGRSFPSRDVRHEEIQPVKKCLDSDCLRVKVTFTAYKSTFEIDLVRNEHFFTDDYVEIYGDAVVKNDAITRSLEPNCYYLSSPTSQAEASLSLCKDQIRGLVTRSGINYVIRFNHEQYAHCIYRSTDLPQADLKCGNTEFIRQSQRKEFEHLRPMIVSKPKVGSEPIVSKSKVSSRAQSIKFVEWVLVIDSTAYKEQFSSDRYGVMYDVREILNHLQGLYAKPNISFHIVLKALIVWGKKDKIKYEGSLDRFVRNFIRYNENELYPRFKQDTTSLLTSKRFREKRLLGFSTKGFTCNAPEISAGVSITHRYTEEKIATILAHEMGHTLGFDDEYYGEGGNCPKGCPSGHCIMTGTANELTYQWSNCTKNIVLRRTLDERYECLSIPKTQVHFPTDKKGIGAPIFPTDKKGIGAPIFSIDKKGIGAPVCGNGVIEQGEECDCLLPLDTGSVELNTLLKDCQKCCDMKECKLTNGSECSSGFCCENCSLKAEGSWCGGAKDYFCDVSDMCDGKSEHCEDRFKQPDFTHCEPNLWSDANLPDSYSSALPHWCIQGTCEFKCLHNCTNHGTCVPKTYHQIQDKNLTEQVQHECHCFTPFYGTFCQYRLSLIRILSFHLITGGILFILSFLITYLALLAVDRIRGSD